MLELAFSHALISIETFEKDLNECRRIMNSSFKKIQDILKTDMFISEIINSIGNLLQYAEKDQAGKFLIPFSDIFAMTIFVFSKTDENGF